MNILGSVQAAVGVRMDMIDAEPTTQPVVRVMARMLVRDGVVSARRVVDLPADTVLVYYLAASERAAHLVEGRTR